MIHYDQLTVAAKTSLRGKLGEMYRMSKCSTRGLARRFQISEGIVRGWCRLDLWGPRRREYQRENYPIKKAQWESMGRMKGTIMETASQQQQPNPVTPDSVTQPNLPQQLSLNVPKQRRKGISHKISAMAIAMKKAGKKDDQILEEINKVDPNLLYRMDLLTDLFSHYNLGPRQLLKQRGKMKLNRAKPCESETSLLPVADEPYPRLRGDNKTKTMEIRDWDLVIAGLNDYLVLAEQRFPKIVSDIVRVRKYLAE